MTRLLLIALLLMPSLAQAETCTIPAGSATDKATYCEEFRQELRVRSTAWSNDLCATQLVRLGLEARLVTATRGNTQEIINDAIDVQRNRFRAAFPLPTQATCGDFPQ